MPDLSSAAEPVQAQVRERYASLARSIENSSAPAAELASAYGEMGKLFTVTEYLDAAEACFLNAQSLAPAEMRWPYYLGHVYRFKNERAKASAAFEHALQLQPDHIATLVWLGDMLLAQNRPEGAAPLFTKALALEPRAAAALYGLGRVALENKDYSGAVTHLERALALVPQASRIHYPLAMAYRGRGDVRRAEAHLRRRGEVDVAPPDPLMDELGGLLQNAAAYEVRGSAALNKRQWAEAVANLRQAIELAPDNAFTRLNLATALYSTGDGRGAMEQFEAAIRLSPGLPKAHYGLGVILEAEGRDREAIERFAEAVTHDPMFVEARLQLGDALRRNGRLEESLAQYAAVLATNPAVSQARFGYAMALVRLRRYQDARTWLADASRTHADQPGFAHALARLLAAAPDDRVRDGRQALALTEALLKQQKTAGLAETMAMVLAELGRFDEAVRWQRDALASAKQSQREAMAGLEENLKLYAAGKPCRIPWRDDDPVHYPRPSR